MIINQHVSGGEGGTGGLDTNDATAYAEHILEGYTAYARGQKITGEYIEAAPEGIGRTDVHTTNTPTQAVYSGIALDILIKETFWIDRLILKLGTTDPNVTLNIRNFTDKTIFYTQKNINLTAEVATEIQLTNPIKVVKSQYIIIEFLFSDSNRRFYWAGSLYNGTLWQCMREHINSYSGTAYSETFYFGFIEIETGS